MRTMMLPWVGRKDVRVVQENYKRRNEQAEGTVFLRQKTCPKLIPHHLQTIKSCLSVSNYRPGVTYGPTPLSNPACLIVFPRTLVTALYQQRLVKSGVTWSSGSKPIASLNRTRSPEQRQSLLCFVTLYVLNRSSLIIFGCFAISLA